MYILGFLVSITSLYVYICIVHKVGLNKLTISWPLFVITKFSYF